jgi:transposase
LAQDGDMTLPELAGALASATGVVAHSASIGRFQRKLGYTYKKSHWSQLKWSGKFGQRVKMYPTRLNGYENDETTELFRQV